MTAKEYRHLISLEESCGYCSAKYICSECSIKPTVVIGANCSTNTAFREAKKLLNRLTEEEKLEILIGELGEL